MATTNPIDFIPKVNTGVGAGGLPPALLKQTATSLSGALRGELPQDVQDLLRQQAAEYGVASGMPGSQFQSYRGLRNLGLTSLDRIKGAEGILGNQFINPGQAQQLQLQAGTARAGLAQQGSEQAQALSIEQARLAQQGKLSREQLANQSAIAAAGEAGANYRASLGLAGHGGSGSSGGGFVGGGTTNTGFQLPEANLSPVGGGYGTNVNAGNTSYDYGYNNPSVVTGVPYDGGSYDDSGGFQNYDDVIDYYGY